MYSALKIPNTTIRNGLLLTILISRNYKKQLYDTFPWIGFNCLNAAETLQGQSLLLTTKTPKIPLIGFKPSSKLLTKFLYFFVVSLRNRYRLIKFMHS